jgi:hypothetical protein
MNLNLIHLEQRIKELELLANEITDLIGRMNNQENVQPDLSIKGQRWYRGAREILVQQNFSGLKEFDNYYRQGESNGLYEFINFGFTAQNEQLISRDEYRVSYIQRFHFVFQAARSLLYSVVDEINSRELAITTELSFHVSTNEFETAKDIFDKHNNEEVFVRAGGIVARVALERHIRTVADARNIVIVRNPPSKPHDDFSDVTTTLMKNGVITSHQKSELDLLYRTGNECAHPQGKVVVSDVKQLIERGRELASMIL